jgi:hypothetical protein
MTRTQREKTVSLSMVKVDDRNLIRHDALAYLDGYADARSNGKDGFWCNSNYSPYARRQYLMGFEKGLRVYNVLSKSI